MKLRYKDGKRIVKTRVMQCADGGRFLIGMDKDGGEHVLETIQRGVCVAQEVRSLFSGLPFAIEDAARKRGLEHRWS